MCQAYEGEREYVVHREKEQIYQRYEAFERGEIEISDDELRDMAVRMLMLREQ
jgi:hypothetical protein